MIAYESISGHQPHESWGGWRNYLSSCEHRDEYEGVVCYGRAHCNYVVFPDGTVVENYGVAGRNLMREIRDRGVEVVHEEIKSTIPLLRRLLAEGHRLHEAQRMVEPSYPFRY